ncbi:MAG: tetratricopeptide repeat protein [bacterium]
MKRVLIGCILIFAFFIARSQSVNTQTAYNFLKEATRAKTTDDKQKKLAEAKKYIDEASANAETSGDAKTWFYKALVYINLYRVTPSDSLLFATALESFKKAYALDTKQKFTEEIRVNVDTLRQNLYQKGVDKFNQRKFEESMYQIERAANLFSILNMTDTTLLLTAAVAAERANRPDKARDYYLVTLKAGKNTPDIYFGLTVFYTKLQDKKGAYDIIKKGRELYPKNQDLIKAETNMYLAFGEDDKALEQLQVIAKEDTANPSVFYAIGTLYNKIFNDTLKSKDERKVVLEKAVAAYEKAIALNPSYFEPFFNLGILYNNVAAEILLKANNLPNDATAEYDKLKAEADSYLSKALPFLEKASEISPTDIDTLMALKQIYVRLKMSDKAKAVNEKIINLQKK